MNNIVHLILVTESTNAWPIRCYSRPGYFRSSEKNKIVLPPGLAATALIAAFLFRQTIVASEEPTYAKITGYASGYWLWLSSAVTATLASAIGLINKTPRHPV